MHISHDYVFSCWLPGAQREKYLFQSTKTALIRGKMSSASVVKAAALVCVAWLSLDGRRSPLSGGLAGLYSRLQLELFFCSITSRTNHDMAFKGKAVDSKVRGQDNVS